MHLTPALVLTLINRIIYNASDIYDLRLRNSHNRFDQLNMSTSRLFRFPKPEWLNSPNTRTAGVYLAGALVGLASRSHLTVISGSDSRITVLTRILLLH